MQALEQDGREDPDVVRRRANGRDLGRAMPKLVADRRRHRRVPVDIAGRFMREDKQEYPCLVTDMSAGGLALATPAVAEIGERIIAYLDDFGRIEGVVARHLDGGFAVKIVASLHRREKIVNQLTWLINRGRLGLSEERRHERVVPRNPFSKLIMPNGDVHDCRVIDVSLSGASIASPLRPPIGTAVVLGRAGTSCATTAKAGQFSSPPFRIPTASPAPSAGPLDSRASNLRRKRPFGPLSF